MLGLSQELGSLDRLVLLSTLLHNIGQESYDSAFIKSIHLQTHGDLFFKRHTERSGSALVIPRARAGPWGRLILNVIIYLNTT